MKQLILYILFEIEYRWTLFLISKMKSNPLTYPVIISLKFNKEKYKKAWYKGISINKTIIKFLEIKRISMQRHIKRLTDKPNLKVMNRYHKIITIKNYNNELNYDIKESFGDTLDNLMKKKK